jgi:hypothetical protein
MNRQKSGFRYQKAGVKGIVYWLFLFATLIPYVPMLAQNNIIVFGRVVDAQTGAIIPLESISVANKSIGTIANDEGEFEFHLTEKYAKDTLMVSAVGFKNHRAAIEKIKDRAPNHRL